MGQKLKIAGWISVGALAGALLDALVSPRHDLSLARALRSPLFAVPDAALIDLALRQRDRQLAEISTGACSATAR